MRNKNEILKLNIIVASFITNFIVGIIFPYVSQIMHLLTKDEWAEIKMVTISIGLLGTIISKLKEKILLWTCLILDLAFVFVLIYVICFQNLKMYLILNNIWGCILMIFYNFRYVIFTKHLDFMRDKNYQGRKKTVESAGLLVGTLISLYSSFSVKTILLAAQVLIVLEITMHAINNKLLLEIKKGGEK